MGLRGGDADGRYSYLAVFVLDLRMLFKRLNHLPIRPYLNDTMKKNCNRVDFRVLEYAISHVDPIGKVRKI